MSRCASLLAVFALCAATANAQVVRLDIASREPMNGGRAVGAAGPFEIIRGTVHGEIDPKDPHNAIIQDLDLAPRNARGKVEYAATFALAKPVDMSKSARLLLYQVVNRGNGQAVASPEGYVSLVSGWQGDVIPTAANQTIAVPIAKHEDGSPVTGPVIARFFDLPNGTRTAPIHLASLGTPQPYPPVDLAQPGARLTWHTRENYSGEQDAAHAVPRGDWAFANCDSTPWPGVPDPARICLKDGFGAGRIYELVYTAKDPLVLGVGLAATRDIVSFFRHAEKDAAGTANPVAGAIDHVVSVGDSQSGNFIRTFIHLGFNQDVQNRIVWDGAFPRIAARQTPINLRFALPGGAAGVYEPGSEGVVWWTHYEDKARGLAAAGLLDRCSASNTCPKIIEAFGSSEFWGLRMSPDLIGTDATHDLPLPDNVRRYYYPGTTHGGGRGGFHVDAAAAPGACTLPANPNPEADQTRALTRALVEWVTTGTPPPESRYPRLASGDLVPATRAAIGYRDIPGLPFSDRILNPVMRYDFGPGFKAADLSGVMSIVPPRILGTVPTYVPRVNEDGNETVGVPSVLMQAPLGTYLGWNTIRAGIFAGQGCGFQGGWIPFAKTKSERLARHDPRLSLEERYGTLENYVAIVKRAADRAVRDRFLLPEDAARIVAEAEASNILPHAAAQVAASSNACERLASLALPHATVTLARAYPAGTFTAGRSFSVPAFCRVAVTSKPTPDSDIGIEVWLPDTWNGKLLGTDNGGFSGAINYAALAGAIANGYAAVSTDTGHAGDQMDFGVGHPEKIVDWAYRSVHEMTLIAKSIVEASEGRPPARAYFSGCSTGGQQALSEAQRFPADYDGIVAGDPGNNRVNLIYGFLWSWLATHDASDAPILPSAKLPALAKAAVAECDRNDGVVDGVIGDPRACHFDPGVLACSGAETDACLTPPQIEAARKVYAGARSKSGQSLYPGWAPGSETGWGTYITNPKEPVRIGLFRSWVFEDPTWNPRSFDWDKDVAVVNAKYPFLNAMSTDYSAFKARGGKLIMYTGLADPVVSPFDTIAYYDSVARAMGGVDATQSFFRFLPVPGMAHCRGGSGTDHFDALAALEAWVEHGTPPDSIPASHATRGNIDRTRPLCAYPAVARYKGSGSIEDAASFSCDTR